MCLLQATLSQRQRSIYCFRIYKWYLVFIGHIVFPQYISVNALNGKRQKQSIKSLQRQTPRFFWFSKLVALFSSNAGVLEATYYDESKRQSTERVQIWQAVYSRQRENERKNSKSDVSFHQYEGTLISGVIKIWEKWPRTFTCHIVLRMIVRQRYGVQRPSGPALVPALLVVVAASVRLLAQVVHFLPSVQVPNQNRNKNEVKALTWPIRETRRTAPAHGTTWTAIVVNGAQRGREEGIMVRDGALVRH